MAVLIDSDILIEIEHGANVDAIYAKIADDDRGVSVITMSELLHGVERATDAERETRRTMVDQLLGSIPIYPITDIVARTHARLWADLAARGKTLGAHDMWIAATALTLGFGVATRNARDFGRVPGLRVVAID